MTISFNFDDDKRTRTESRRPTQAVPVSYVRHWFYFLMVLCLLIAWYFPMKIIISYLMWPPVAEYEVRDANVFAVLAYEGVSSRDGEVSPAQFRDHINTLREHGFNPITLEDVRALFHEGELLPARAVLTTFDHGRRTSYFETKAHMRRNGWRGVMFLWTLPIEERDTASLLWPYVRRMIRTPTWEIGMQSHHGFDPVVANAAGRTGRFMTTPRWLEREQRFERPDEFSARLQEDHEFQLALVERRARTRPIAFAYPYGDFGQFRTRGEFIRRVNLAQVEHFYDLGFVSGNLAINTQYSDPRRLNRLRVRPDWDGNELVAFLERSWPSASPDVDLDEGRSAAAWIVDWGEMDVEDGRLSLHASDHATGAKMWLAGSDLSRDFYARIQFRLRQGQMGLYVRASPDEESYVYLGLDSRGEAWLREKQLGRDEERWEDERLDDLSVWLRQKQVAQERFTLASARAAMQPRDSHVVEVFVRDRLLYARVNGEPLFETHVKIRGEPRPGMFGVSVWDPERGRARVDIDSVVMQSQQPTLALWEEQRGYSPHLVQWIHDHAYQLTQISPPWISFSPMGQQVRHHWDDSIVDRLARIYGLDVVPRVNITQQEWLAHLPPSMLTEMAKERGFEHVFVNLSYMANATPSRVTSWLQQTYSALKDQGIELLVQMPASLEQAATLHSMLAVIPGLPLAVTEGSPVTSRAAVRVESVPPPQEDDAVPIYYQIMALPEASEAVSGQERLRSLEERGLAAFREGDYGQAEDLWREWLTLDSRNPRPLMLLGDVYLRLNRPLDAIAYYDRSLDMDPGQIALALRRARILRQQDKTDEAIESLNLYARLFPDNTNILLAQAELLHDERRPNEARRLAERVLQVQPYNLDALTMLIRWAETPVERLDYLNQIVREDLQAEAQIELGNMIWRYDLLSIPEAHSLRHLVNRIYRETENPRVRQIFEKLNLQDRHVSEDFAVGELSGNWWVHGGLADTRDDTLHLQAEAGRTEVSLRLLGSERLRDSYIETKITEWHGSFWLYARRSANQMVRLGFEESPERLYLQIWRDGHVILNESTTVVVPTNQVVTLRLEMRGDGMMGYFNGFPLFDASIPVPRDLWLGWTGVAAFDVERGTGRVALKTLGAGALPLRIAMLPEQTTDHDLDILLDGLRDHVRSLSDIAPRFFTMRQNLQLESHLGAQHRLVRLFARYHRLRFIPIVEVQSEPDQAMIPIIIGAIREHRLDGAILLMQEMPADEWFRTAGAELALHSVDVHVMVKDEGGHIIHGRPLGAAMDLYFDEEQWSLPRLSGSLRDRDFNQMIENWPLNESIVLDL